MVEELARRTMLPPNRMCSKEHIRGKDRATMTKKGRLKRNGRLLEIDTRISYETIRSVKKAKVIPISVDKAARMFEDLCLIFLRQVGFIHPKADFWQRVHPKPVVSVVGEGPESFEADIWVETPRPCGGIEKMLIECKNFSRPVDRGCVQKLYDTSQLLRAIPVLVSRSGFTAGALVRAKATGVICISLHGVPPDPKKFQRWFFAGAKNFKLVPDASNPDLFHAGTGMRLASIDAPGRRELVITGESAASGIIDPECDWLILAFDGVSSTLSSSGPMDRDDFDLIMDKRIRSAIGSAGISDFRWPFVQGGPYGCRLSPHGWAWDRFAQCQAKSGGYRSWKFLLN